MLTTALLPLMVVPDGVHGPNGELREAQLRVAELAALCCTYRRTLVPSMDRFSLASASIRNLLFGRNSSQTQITNARETRIA